VVLTGWRPTGLGRVNSADKQNGAWDEDSAKTTQEDHTWCPTNDPLAHLVSTGQNHCAEVLGALAGVRRAGPVSLVHLDGHSDFRHPGNYDPAVALGAVAGMDLALATGRGEALMTDWPDVASPLVPEEHVIQIGEREGHSPNFAWPDVEKTAMTRIDVFAARQIGPQAVIDRTNTTLDQEPNRPFWIHFDVDVLDQAVMPAVDTPGTPGIDLEDVTVILRSLIAAPRCRGMSVTIFDPDLDSTGELARLFVHLLKGVFDSCSGVARNR